MRRASDAPWKVWGNRLVYRMSRTEKISGRRDDLGGRARGPVRQRQLRRGSLLLLTANHDQGGEERARAPNKCGVTDTLDCFWRATASTAERNRRCERLIHARIPAPLPTHRGPVRDSQWSGRRNLPRRGTPRRAPV